MGENTEYSWRSNTSIFALEKNVEVLKDVLKQYIERNKLFEEENRIIDSCPEETKWKIAEALSIKRLSEIKIPTPKLYIDIRSMIDSSILMACIDLEASINCFCYYNLGEECTTAIESLNMVNKLTICHRMYGKENFNSTKYYQAIYELNKWRNSYAHGKLTDVKSNDIRKNHLENPEKLPHIYDYIKDFLKYMKYYNSVHVYMQKLTEHEFTSSLSLNVKNIGEIINEIENLDYEILKDDVL